MKAIISVFDEKEYKCKDTVVEIPVSFPQKCTECDVILSADDVLHNEECGIDHESWTCISCDSKYCDEQFN